MATLLISTRLVLLFLVLFQPASLYKVYELGDTSSDFSNDLFSSSFDQAVNHRSANMKNLEFNDEDDIFTNNDEESDNLTPRLSLTSETKQQREPLWTRSTSPIKSHSSKIMLYRRQRRPHWNPLVAAYRRCGELPTQKERASCFEDAIQKLFVFKLRK